MTKLIAKVSFVKFVPETNSNLILVTKYQKDEEGFLTSKTMSTFIDNEICEQLDISKGKYLDFKNPILTETEDKNGKLLTNLVFEGVKIK